MTEAHQSLSGHVLLICSVGGTPEPIVRSLLHWQPARIIFVPSNETRSHVDLALRAFAEASNRPLSPGQYAIKVVSDAEDLLSSVATLSTLRPEVADWAARSGGDYRVVVDFTAGTKCMSTALALVARRWPCQYSYVGGQRRTKGGTGVVESGSERVVHCANPWDALGYQAVEDAVTVSNHGGYAAAAAMLEVAVRNAQQPDVKRELSTLKAVIDAYAAWDRFEHKTAAQRFADALRNRNDLAAIFPHESRSLIERLQRQQTRVLRLAEQASPEQPSTEWVEDLVQNARRRAAECRYDDAVARLYRACEARAQLQLRERHGIPDTKSVSLEQLPESLRQKWANRGRDGRTFPLGLQDAYLLLKERDDELGHKFFELGLADDQRSPLVTRNQSILAHGFQPVGEPAYTSLSKKLSELVQLDSGTSDDWRLPPATPTESAGSLGRA